MSLEEDFIIDLEERHIKDLLKILLDNIHYLDSGLCRLCFHLNIKNKISKEELRILEYFFERNKPNGVKIYDLWFPSGIKQPRIEWLKKQIEQ